MAVTLYRQVGKGNPSAGTSAVPVVGYFGTCEYFTVIGAPCSTTDFVDGS